MALPKLSTLPLGIAVPSDVLILILENLNDIAPTSLSDLRTVSNCFDSFVVPIVYRHVNLTPRIVARCAVGQRSKSHDKAGLQVVRDMRKYTRHVSIGVVLNWSWVNHILQEKGHLVSIT